MYIYMYMWPTSSSVLLFIDIITENHDLTWEQILVYCVSLIIVSSRLSFIRLHPYSYDFHNLCLGSVSALLLDHTHLLENTYNSYTGHEHVGVNWDCSNNSLPPRHVSSCIVIKYRTLLHNSWSQKQQCQQCLSLIMNNTLTARNNRG